MKKLLSSILILTLGFYSFNLECLAIEPNNQGNPEQTLPDLDAGFSIESENKQDKQNATEEIKNSSSSENDKRTIMEKTADVMKENLKKHNEQVKNEIQKIENMSGWRFRLYLIKANIRTIILASYLIYFFGVSLQYFIINYNLGFLAGHAEGVNRVSGHNDGSRCHLFTLANNVQKILEEVLAAIKSGDAKNFDSVKELYYNANSLYDTYLKNKKIF